MEQKFGKNGKTVFLDEPSGKAERLCITPQQLSRIRKAVTFSEK